MSQNKLVEICQQRLADANTGAMRMPLYEMEKLARQAPAPRGFISALKKVVQEQNRPGLIAEIKSASPSKGLIRDDFAPPRLAKIYEESGAACLSVLTEPRHFKGNNHHLVAARRAVSLPVLRKDFILTPWQIAEARSLGADCILLIMAALDPGLAKELEAYAHELAMDVLLEVHDADEMERTFKLKSELIGINNRNLRTLKVDIQTTIDLAKTLPDGRMLVSESGIKAPEDILQLQRAGASCFLIGEAFMREDDIALAVKRMLGTPS